MTKLIVISSEKDLEHEVDLIHQLFDEGLELFHLRKPHWNIFNMLEFLKKIKFEHLNKISIHDHHTLVKAFDLKYIHFRKNERKYFSDYLSGKRNFNKGKQIHISSSFNEFSELENYSTNLNYCFLSPVYDSISKEGYKQGISSTFSVPKSCSTKVFALGGINENNIKPIFERGFHGAAVLGAVWKNPTEAVSNFKKIRNKC